MGRDSHWMRLAVARCMWLPLVALIAACAGPQVVVTPQPTEVRTLEKAREYVGNADKTLEAKKQEVVNVQQYARAGTFIGTIGLGAAALSNLHRDAAIGFGALAAISAQGLPLAAPTVWYGNCSEAQAALSCIDGVTTGSMPGSAISMRAWPTRRPLMIASTRSWVRWCQAPASGWSSTGSSLRCTPRGVKRSARRPRSRK